ncbi:hypothetical protein TIFTF001_040689, partial [Ficus carica]
RERDLLESRPEVELQLELTASRGIGWSHGPKLALGQLEEELGWQLKGISRGLGSRRPDWQLGLELRAGFTWAGVVRAGLSHSWRYLRKKGEEKKGK